MLFLLGSAAVAIAVVPILMISSTYEFQQVFDDVQHVTHSFHALCSGIMSALCVYFIFKMKSWKNSGKLQFMKSTPRTTVRPAQSVMQLSGEDTGKHQAYKPYKVPILQVVVFGVGACLWLTFRIIYAASFYDDVEWDQIMNEATYMLWIPIQIWFLVKYDGAILPNSYVFHYSLALILADEVWLWLSETLNHIAVDPIDDYVRNNSEMNLNISAFYKTVEIGTVFLQPFFMEFLAISIGVVFHLWNAVGTKITEEDVVQGVSNGDQDYHVIDSDQHDRGTPDLDCSFNTSAQRGPVESTTICDKDVSKSSLITTYLYSLVVSGLAVGLFFCVLILSQISPFDSTADSLKDHTKYMLSYSIQIATFITTIIGCIVAKYKAYKNNNLLLVSFSSSDYLLFFTCALNFTWFFFRIISSATFLSTHSEAEFLAHRDEAICVFCYAVVCIVQVWAQTQMLLVANSIRKTGGSISRFTRYLLIYLGGINIAFWLIIAIAREDVINPHNKPRLAYMFMNKCFGEATTRMLVFFFYPAMELYRFHSAVVAYEILT